MRSDSLPRLWRYINLLLTYLLTIWGARWQPTPEVVILHSTATDPILKTTLEFSLRGHIIFVPSLTDASSAASKQIWQSTPEVEITFCL